MEINWDTHYIDSKNLISISRGDKDRLLKYLEQFQQLVPQRSDSLQESLAKEDRKMVRQVVHQMSPQLQFFGIQGVLPMIRQIEHEHQTMPLDQLAELIDDLLDKLQAANQEVARIINENF